MDKVVFFSKAISLIDLIQKKLQLTPYDIILSL